MLRELCKHPVLIGVVAIDLVHRDDDGLAAKVRVAEGLGEDLAALRDPILVRAVHHEDAPVHVRHVRLPDAADALAAAQIVQVDVEAGAMGGLVVEAERGEGLLGRIPEDGLQQRGLARAVEPDEDLRSSEDDDGQRGKKTGDRCETSARRGEGRDGGARAPA